MGNKAVTEKGRRAIGRSKIQKGNRQWTKGKRKAILVKGRERKEEERREQDVK